MRTPFLRAIVLVGFGIVCSTPLVAQTPNTQPLDGIRNTGIPTTALTNARIVPKSGKLIEKGTIVIRDGKIVEIGENVAVPASYKVIDLAGKTIYPAWIDSYTEVEIAMDSTKGTHYWNNNVAPERKVADQYTPNATQLGNFRKAGIGAILAIPQGGIIRGTSALVTTGSKPADRSIITPAAADHVRLTTGFRIGGGGGYPTSPMGAVALARQAFHDADWYGRAWQSYRAQPGLPQPEKNDSLEALVQLTKSGRSVVFDAMNEQYAMRADKFAREFSLPMILHGSGREYRLLDKLVGMNRAMIIPVNFPKAPNVTTPELANGVPLQDLMHWELAPENPARLVAAGCKIAITSEGLENPEELRAQLRAAIKRGLSPDAALDAVTIHPAEMFGAESVLGTLGVGKWANLLVASGDLWDEKTKIDETWVQGDRFKFSEDKPIEVGGTWNIESLGAAEKPSQLILKLETDKKLKGSLSLPKPKEAEGAPVEKPAEGEPPSPSDKAKEEEKSAEAKPQEQASDKAADGEKPVDGEKSGRGGKGGKKKEEGVVELESIQFSDTKFTAIFPVKDLKAGNEGRGQLSLVLFAEPNKPKYWRGSIVWADGSVSVVHAIKSETAEEKKPDEKKADAADGKKDEAKD